MSLEDLTTDQLLARARELEGSANLLTTLAQNPATRGDLQRLMKKANPSLVIPEIDAADAVRGEIRERDERINRLEQQMLEDKVRTRLEKQRSDARAKYNLSDADMVEVEKLMTHEDTEQRIPGYDAAARVYASSKQNTVPTPASLNPPTFTMPENDVWGKGIGNKAALDKIAMNEAFSAWNDAVGGRFAKTV